MKKFLTIFIILLWGCEKPELPTPEVLSKDDIFRVTETTIINGQSINFNLSQQGTYILTLIDKETNQVIGREKFIGQSGKNIKKIYTNSLQTQYLYLTLEDINKKELSRTIIIKK
jgi:hypothetical protein